MTKPRSISQPIIYPRRRDRLTSTWAVFLDLYWIRSFKTGSRYWLIDPLDDNKAFIQRTGKFACNLALIDSNRMVYRWGSGTELWLRYAITEDKDVAPKPKGLSMTAPVQPSGMQNSLTSLVRSGARVISTRKPRPSLPPSRPRSN